MKRTHRWLSSLSYRTTVTHKGKKVKVTLQHSMQAQPRSVAELHLYSFFNPGARLGWMIRPRPGRFFPWKNAVSIVQKVGCVLVRKMSPTLELEPRTVQPEARGYNYCTISAESEGVQVVKNSLHIRWGGLPLKTSRGIPHPNNVLRTRRNHCLDLYGRPRSTATALSSWERTPGGHTTQGASCIQDAATHSIAHIAASPEQCRPHVSGRCRWTRWHSLWARLYEGSGGLL
jgi:hypothetical protein